MSLRKKWPKVLIVEDEPDAGKLATWVVQQLWPAADVHLALDGNSGLKDAAQFRPDLVLTDIRIPGASGLEVCRTIKQDQVLSSTKVIAMTGVGDEALRRECLKTGADDYLTKPIDPYIWRNSLARVMGERQPGTGPAKDWQWIG